MKADLYKSTLLQSPMGFAYHRIICDDQGQPYDYEFLEVNPAFEKMCGLSGEAIVGKKVSEVIPGIRQGEFDWVALYGEVALYGGEKEFEQFAEPLQKWYRVYVYSPEKKYFITCFTDITNEMRQIAERERFFQINLDMLCIADVDGNFIKVNQAFEKILGFPAAELEKMSFFELVHPEDLAATEDVVAKLSAQEQVTNFVNRFRCQNGSYRYLEWQSQPYGNLIYGAARDITGNKLSQEALTISESRLKRAQSIAKVGNWELDLHRQEIWASEEAFRIYGVEQDSPYLSLVGVQKLVIPADRPMMDQALKAFLKDGTAYNVEFRIIRKKDGQERIINSCAEMEFSPEGLPIKVLGVLRDITDSKKKEQEILYLNKHDVLTGLYNRLFFEEERERLDVEDQLPLSVIIGDVNGLKLINDAFGHHQGDKLLVVIGNILRKSSRNQDFVCRMGGDEFCILLPQTNSEEAQAITRRIYQACRDYPSQWHEKLFHPSIALGNATKTRPEESMEGILKAAEEFMYRRKLLERKSIRSSVISSIKTTMFEKSHETEAHAERLVALSRQLGQAMQLSDEQLNELCLFSTLHDLGKVSIDERILLKPEQLTDAEWLEMKKHPEVGYRIALASPELVPIADYILCHHERWDGQGYPQGLSGEAIPLLARILAIADAFDAMTEDRPYRKALSKAEAIAEIILYAGKQFDPQLAGLFVREVHTVSEE